MRPSLCLWAVGALAISHVQAEYTLNSTAAMELPKCVTDCGLTVLPKMNCTLGADCYCARGGPVAIALTACVMAACPSLREPIQGLKFQADGCHWPRDRDLSTAALTVNVALFAFTTLFLTARLASRMPRWSGAGFSWDDGRLLCRSKSGTVPLTGRVCRRCLAMLRTDCGHFCRRCQHVSLRSG